MNARAKLAAGVGMVTALGAVGAVALAQGGGDFNGRLTGYQEVPALSTSGHGTFRASIRSGGSAIRYRLTYAGLEAKPTQAHIHLGQPGVNSGVTCSCAQHRRRAGRHAALPGLARAPCRAPCTRPT